MCSSVRVGMDAIFKWPVNASQIIPKLEAVTRNKRTDAISIRMKQNTMASLPIYEAIYKQYLSGRVSVAGRYDVAGIDIRSWGSGANKLTTFHCGLSGIPSNIRDGKRNLQKFTLQPFALPFLLNIPFSVLVKNMVCSRFIAGRSNSR